MKVFPKIDWISHADTVITGPGGVWEPARMAAANLANRKLSQPARILSSYKYKTFFDIDFGQARPVEAVTVVDINAGNLAASLSAKARVIATDDYPIVDELAPDGLSLANCTGSLSDIDDDPDDDDGVYLVYGGAGDCWATCEFPLTAGGAAAAYEPGEIRVLVASTDGASHTFDVEAKAGTVSVGGAVGLSTSATAAAGGELFSVEIDPEDFLAEPSGADISVVVKAAETSGASVVLGAIRMYLPTATVAGDHDSGWISMFPAGLEDEADVLRFPTRWTHVFPAEVNRRYMRIWIDNPDNDFLDVGTALCGAALTPLYGFSIQGASSWATEDSSLVELSESGEGYEEVGLVRDVHRYLLHLLGRDELHTLRTYFDRVKGLGTEFVVVPDETDPARFFYEVVYGRALGLSPANFAGVRRVSGTTEAAFQRELSIREVSLD